MNKTKISKLDELVIKLRVYESIIRQLESVLTTIRCSIDIERKKQ